MPWEWLPHKVGEENYQGKRNSNAQARDRKSLSCLRNREQVPIAEGQSNNGQDGLREEARPVHTGPRALVRSWDLSRGSGRHWVVVSKIMIWSDLHFNKIILAALVKWQLILTPWKASFHPVLRQQEQVSLTPNDSLIWKPHVFHESGQICLAENTDITGIQLPHQLYSLSPVHYGKWNWACWPVVSRPSQPLLNQEGVRRVAGLAGTVDTQAGTGCVNRCISPNLQASFFWKFLNTCLLRFFSKLHYLFFLDVVDPTANVEMWAVSLISLFFVGLLFYHAPSRPKTNTNWHCFCKKNVK